MRNKKKEITAAIVVIGNEVLSGRTQDKNINFIASELVKIGIRLEEVRVIPDSEKKIINTVNELRRKFTYIFTTGGIGPTHDDITSTAIAKAFKVKLMLNQKAVKAMKSHYKPGDLNEARLKMAYIPKGAKLINNPVSKAPGFVIKNVYVMAGIPIIMQAMFSEIKSTLRAGKKIKSRTVSTNITEGTMATALSKIQNQNLEVEIGSYPYIKNGEIGVSLVIRSENDDKLDEVCKKIKSLLINLKGKILQEE